MTRLAVNTIAAAAADVRHHLLSADFRFAGGAGNSLAKLPGGQAVVTDNDRMARLQAKINRRDEIKRALKGLKRAQYDAAKKGVTMADQAAKTHAQKINDLEAERLHLTRGIWSMQRWIQGAGQTACPCCGKLKAKQHFQEVYAGADPVCNACAKLLKKADRAGRDGHE